MKCRFKLQVIRIRFISFYVENFAQFHKIVPLVCLFLIDRMVTLRFHPV